MEKSLSRRFSEQKSYEGVEILKFSQLKYHKLQDCEQGMFKNLFISNERDFKTT